MRGGPTAFAGRSFRTRSRHLCHAGQFSMRANETSRIKFRLSATRFAIVPHFRNFDNHPVVSCFSVPVLLTHSRAIGGRLPASAADQRPAIVDPQLNFLNKRGATGKSVSTVNLHRFHCAIPNTDCRRHLDSRPNSVIVSFDGHHPPSSSCLVGNTTKPISQMVPSREATCMRSTAHSARCSTATCRLRLPIRLNGYTTTSRDIRYHLKIERRVCRHVFLRS